MVTLHLRHSDDELDLVEAHRTDTARVWLSDQQWMSILERIERKSREAMPPDDAESQRAEPRYVHDTRCLLRVGSHGPDCGTFMVRTRNISSGGLGFVHSEPMSTGTRCTVALETDDGHGVIASARVAWCREILQLEVESAMFEVGVQFDRPIDLEPFGHVA